MQNTSFWTVDEFTTCYCLNQTEVSLQHIPRTKSPSVSLFLCVSNLSEFPNISNDINGRKVKSPFSHQRGTWPVVCSFICLKSATCCLFPLAVNTSPLSQNFSPVFHRSHVALRTDREEPKTDTSPASVSHR